MLRVTFYSYKGGVGRTMALLNVAAVLARRGRRVVAVDLDLEAPGFGLSDSTEGREAQPGASDLLLGRKERREVDLRECVYPILSGDDGCGDRLLLMPAGTRADELSDRLPGFYARPDSDDAYLFEWLAASIGDALEPDYLFFDSRTGRADVAGVCTVELPDVLVAVCGLNEQNVRGMESVLEELSRHPARVQPVATILAVGPVPRARDMGFPSPRELVERHPWQWTEADIEHECSTNPILDALVRVQTRLVVPIWRWFDAVRGYFPRARPRRDLYHEFPYDPTVPITDELRLAPSSELTRAHERLAQSLTRLHPSDEVLELAEVDNPAVWIRDRHR